jgi:predicted transcriptional regulator of viral defense system
VTALQSAGHDVFKSCEAVSQGTDLGLKPGHTRKLLHELAASGRVVRVKKGLYAVIDPVTGSTTAHAYEIGTSIVQPSAISHWSALSHWGLTEQIPTVVMVSSPKRTFPPRSQSTHPRVTWEVGQSQFQIITIPKTRFFGVEYVWMNERSRIPIFDRERALLDAFQHFDVFGAFSGTLGMVEDHLGEIDVPRLVSYAVKLGIGAVAKRVGWAMSSAGVDDSVLIPLRNIESKGDAPLDPGRPARGRHDPRWHVIENLRS